LCDEEVMSRDPVTSQADDDLEKVVDLLEEHHVRRIPVVDENNHVRYALSQTDI
jgi:acetoin utilization protein AcuB